MCISIVNMDVFDFVLTYIIIYLCKSESNLVIKELFVCFFKWQRVNAGSVHRSQTNRLKGS